MGPWNSDGFSVTHRFDHERAGHAESLANLKVRTALPRLRTAEGTKTLVEMLEDFGPALVERIVDAYREFSISPRPSVLMQSRNTS